MYIDVYAEEISENRGLFNLADNGVTGSIGWKLKLENSRLEMRCALLKVRLSHWSHLSKDEVDCL